MHKTIANKLNLTVRIRHGQDKQTQYKIPHYHNCNKQTYQKKKLLKYITKRLLSRYISLKFDMCERDEIIK